ncbi:MAG: DUF2279 domain-containing protein [Bacteroidota bacterium]
MRLVAGVKIFSIVVGVFLASPKFIACMSPSDSIEVKHNLSSSLRSLSPIPLRIARADSSALRLSQSGQFRDEAFHPKVSYSRLAFIGGTSLAVGVGVHIYQNRAWWLGTRAPFHVENDWSYAMNFDKIGHFWAAELLSSIYADLYKWAGVERKQALLYSAATGFLYELYVEIEDGLHRDWGFSPGDAFGDVLGAFYPILQEQFPFLQNFSLKWSYLPNREYLDRYGTNHAFIDDYQGTTFWATARIHNLLPGPARDYWPGFLNLAVGLNVQKIYQGGRGERHWFISLDYDLESLPGEGAFWKSLKRVLNHVHFPAPAVQISPNVVWYGMFFTVR